MLDLQTTFSTLAARLNATGYDVLPLDGKAPKIPNWTKVPITLRQIDQWAAEKPKANIGLRCNKALMVDIDITDGAEARRISQLIMERFPGALIRRRGESAKLALLYRRSDPDGSYKQQGRKKYNHPTGAVVELFDNSGVQMGIFSSGLEGGDYHWDGPSPLDIPFDELAPLSPWQWDALRGLLSEQGYCTNASPKLGNQLVPNETGNPVMAAGWNNQVFHRVGEMVRQGLSLEAILSEAEAWRWPGYSEAETQAEVTDMANRWAAYLAQNDRAYYEAWRAGWVYEAEGNRFWKLDGMTPMLHQAFRTANGHLRFKVMDEKGQDKIISYSDLFTRDPKAQKVDRTVVAPEQPLITDDRYLNLWRDYWARLHADKGQPDGSEAVQLFRELVDFLCDGRDEMIDTLLNWVGYGLFHPAQRLRWSILLISDLKGAGKSLLCTTVARLYGMDNASILPGLVGLLSQFNGSVLQGKALVVVNETVDKGDSSKFGAVETLKSLITEDQISVEHKGRDRHQIDNYARFMFCSNHLDGLPFDENERRFFAIVCQATEALDADFYARFVEACHSEQGLADIAAWLRDHYTSPLPSIAPPSDTALVQEELVEDWVATLNDLADENGGQPVALSSKDMIDIADLLSGRKLIDAHRSKALGRGGWKRGKLLGKRCYWRGHSKPSVFDQRLKRRLWD